MDKSNILIVTRDYPPGRGGQGVYASRIHKRFLDKGLNSHVLTSRIEEKIHSATYQNVHDVKAKMGRASFVPRACIYFFRKLRKYKWDIIHGNGIDHVFLLLFKRKDVKYVTTIQNSYPQRLETKRGNIPFEILYRCIFIPIEKFVLKRSDEIIAVSNRTYSYVSSMTKNKHIHLIGNGVDSEKFIPVEKDTDVFRFIFIGRFEERKRPLFTVKMFEEVQKRYKGEKKLELYMLSDGSMFETVRKYVEDNRLGSVHFTGFVPDPNEYIKLCHCIVLFSHGEGLPLVIVESVAAGLAAVATVDATGGSDVVKNGVNGYVVSDDIDEEEIIAGMLHTIGTFNQFSAESKKIGRTYDWDAVADDIIRVYE